jgi:hypothetical protein
MFPSTFLGVCCFISVAVASASAHASQTSLVIVNGSGSLLAAPPFAASSVGNVGALTLESFAVRAPGLASDTRPISCIPMAGPAPGSAVRALLEKAATADTPDVAHGRSFLQNLERLDSTESVEPGEVAPVPEASTAVAGSLSLLFIAYYIWYRRLRRTGSLRTVPLPAPGAP